MQYVNKSVYSTRQFSRELLCSTHSGAVTVHNKWLFGTVSGTFMLKVALSFNPILPTNQGFHYIQFLKFKRSLAREIY